MRLRSSDIDAAAGSFRHLTRIVEQIRAAWPEVKITIRADSGFRREEVMRWCEDNRVDFILGLAKNPRLVKEITAESEQTRQQFETTKQPARVFKSCVTRRSRRGSESVAWWPRPST